MKVANGQYLVLNPDGTIGIVIDPQEATVVGSVAEVWAGAEGQALARSGPMPSPVVTAIVPVTESLVLGTPIL